MWFEGLVHDAVLIWAYGVNRTLERGGVPDDGVSIANNSFNTFFQGVSGTVSYYLKYSCVLLSEILSSNNLLDVSNIQWDHVFKNKFHMNVELMSLEN